MTSGVSSPSVVLRADASAEIDIGHVARCQTLGAALVHAGWRATLATRQLPDGLRRSCEAVGIAVLDLPTAMRLDAEPDSMGEQLASQPDLLVVDGYAIDDSWLGRARAWAPLQMAIDDLADRPLPVDVLLNQNLGAEADRYRTLVSPRTRLLIGAAYALLRPEFAIARAALPARDGRIERAIVFLSGGDAGDVTRRAAEGVVAAGLAADVVVGAAYPHLNGLRAWAAGRSDVELHVDTDGMADLMARADVAVGAPGSASWERCALGLPTVLITLADNQVAASEQLAGHGAALSLGWQADVEAADVAAALAALRADPDRVRRMSTAAAAITDGRGVERVVAAIGDVREMRP